LKHIVEIIDNSGLADDIKIKSEKIFERLAEAEAKVHNTTPEKIHFHEVGAIDAIIDIVGSVICLNLLGIDKVYASKIHVGTGFVECAHGKIPIPAPATSELLKNIPIYSTGIQNELTTPTGAAIITTLAQAFGNMPPMILNNTGYGAGSRDLEIPNMLRVLVGEFSESDYESDTVTIIETNIDDMNPEHYEYLMEQLFEKGALDATLTPIIMKKSRPGLLMTVISPAKILDDLLNIVFSETTTFGVRIRQIERKILKRKIKTVKTRFGKIRVKIGYFNNQTKAVPEYEDCRRAAKEAGVPIREIYQEAQKNFDENHAP
jgi:uncharacterized protein (TIGR00299 family) protein